MQQTLGKLPIQKLLVEVFSIVLAVLLALAMNQWRERRGNRALAETALSNIELELRSNQDLLLLLNENNRSVTASLAGEDPETGNPPAFVPGLQLQEIAWNAFLSTGVSSYVDYGTVLMLSKLYSIQEVYKELGSQVVQAELNSAAYAVAAGTTIDEEQKLEQFSGFLELLVAIEIELLQTYEVTLAELDES
jgi:hypothetical protein